MSDASKLRDVAMATVHGSERREMRYELPFQIEVAGIDTEGRVFRERLFTRNVSQWGCGFLSSMELRKDDIVAVRLIPPEGPSERPAVRFQVVRAERTSDGWEIGAWKMDTGDAWGIELERIAAPQAGDVSLRKPENDPDESDEQ